MSKINIHVPDHLHAKLLAFLLVVYGEPPNDAVQFRHKESPIPTFEHRKAAVVKALHLLGWGLISKVDLEVLFPLLEPGRLILCRLPLLKKLNGLHLDIVIHLNDLFTDPSVQEHLHSCIADLQGSQLLFADLLLVKKSVDQ